VQINCSRYMATSIQISFNAKSSDILVNGPEDGGLHAVLRFPRGEGRRERRSDRQLLQRIAVVDHQARAVKSNQSLPAQIA
jgi:hypothetical protein